METYLTVGELAEYLKLNDQTIRGWVCRREIPFCKIRKVLRFRLSEIEKWIDEGGFAAAGADKTDDERDLFGSEE